MRRTQLGRHRGLPALCFVPDVLGTRCVWGKLEDALRHAMHGPAAAAPGGPVLPAGRPVAAAASGLRFFAIDLPLHGPHRAAASAVSATDATAPGTPPATPPPRARSGGLAVGGPAGARNAPAAAASPLSVPAVAAHIGQQLARLAEREPAAVGRNGVVLVGHGLSALAAMHNARSGAPWPAVRGAFLLDAAPSPATTANLRLDDMNRLMSIDLSSVPPLEHPSLPTDLISLSKRKNAKFYEGEVRRLLRRCGVAQQNPYQSHLASAFKFNVTAKRWEWDVDLKAVTAAIAAPDAMRWPEVQRALTRKLANVGGAVGAQGPAAPAAPAAPPAAGGGGAAGAGATGPRMAVVFGGDSPYYEEGAVRRLQAMFGGPPTCVEVDVVPAATHFLHATHAEDVAKRLAGWLHRTFPPAGT